MAARTFVLVHGGFHGGWCWRRVADRLVAGGHRVYAPTNTGLGERKHLLSKEITLETFIDDVLNVIEAEELESITLVGHSFGGHTVAGVADRVPQRIARLVFLDTNVIVAGRSALDGLIPRLADRDSLQGFPDAEVI